MGRRSIDSNAGNWLSVGIILLGLLACTLAYVVISVVLKPSNSITDFDKLAVDENDGSNLERENVGECCRGIPNLELWGSAVKWGTDHKFNSAEECCKSCKAMCSGKNGPCLCDTWVFCGDRQACGSKFGECWLKKQKDTLAPQRQDAGSNVMWTSGLVFGKGEVHNMLDIHSYSPLHKRCANFSVSIPYSFSSRGTILPRSPLWGIIGLETEHGTLHIKLYPDSAPYSVQYILELLTLGHCAGCQFYRAEDRGDSWDLNGNHITDASFGPPYALIQGTLEAAGTSFQQVPAEVCRTIKRGAVAWVGSGPEFFISLANHVEWRKAYTVFGSVLPEDMVIAEKIAKLPTRPDVWNNVNVSVLEKPVPISIQRIKTDNDEDLTHRL